MRSRARGPACACRCRDEDPRADVRGAHAPPHVLPQSRWCAARGDRPRRDGDPAAGWRPPGASAASRGRGAAGRIAGARPARPRAARRLRVATGGAQQVRCGPALVRRSARGARSIRRRRGRPGHDEQGGCAGRPAPAFRRRCSRRSRVRGSGTTSRSCTRCASRAAGCEQRSRSSSKCCPKLPCAHARS